MGFRLADGPLQEVGLDLGGHGHSFQDRSPDEAALFLPVPLVGVSPGLERVVASIRAQRFEMKYVLDRALALVALLVILPLLIAIAAAVMVSMGRPVFYRQPRVGLHGRRFDMLKFRTMTGNSKDSGEADIDWALQELAGSASSGHLAAADRDRRTSVGRVLRRYSLDELPQILNVLRGDMSFIGPRPERASYVSRFETVIRGYSERHRVKPGMTGWAQVNGLRGRTSLRARVKCDNYYIENWSPLLEFKILARTFPSLVSDHEH